MKRETGATIFASFVVLMSLTACTSVDAGAPVTSTSSPTEKTPPGTSSQPAATCPTTAEDSASALPTSLPDDDELMWHGEGQLWVELANFTHPVDRQDGSLRVKYAWWTSDPSGEALGIGPPIVSAEPLHGGDVVVASFGGYASAGTGEDVFSWWPTTLDFPEPGCWKLTGRLNETTVNAVVEVLEASQG